MRLPTVSDAPSMTPATAAEPRTDATASAATDFARLAAEKATLEAEVATELKQCLQAVKSEARGTAAEPTTDATASAATDLAGLAAEKATLEAEVAAALAGVLVKSEAT